MRAPKLRPRRLSWKWVSVALLTGALVWAAAAAGGWDLLTAPGSENRAGRRSQAFILRAGQTLDFEMPSRATEIRLLTTAFLSPGQGIDTGDAWTYSLAIDGTARAQHVHTFRSRPTLYLGDDDQPTYSLSVVAGASLEGAIPLDGRAALLPLSEANASPRLTLRAEQLGPDIEAVGLRLYFREQIPARRRAVIWPRLSREQQEQRAAGNVYPPELLTRSEREQLMSWRWSPLAPSGVEGEDYERVVFNQLDNPGRPVRAGVRDSTRSSVPAGVELELAQFGAQLRISLASGEGELTDQLEHLGGPAPEWDQLRANAAETAPAPGTRVRAKQALTLRNLGDAEERLAERLRLYSCAEEPVRFALLHAAAATPVRIDLRAATTTTPRETTATVRLLDGSEAEIHRVSWTSHEPLSSTDWLQLDDGSQRVSEPSRRFLSTQTAATHLEVECRGDDYISVYNRPAGRVTRRGTGRDELRARDWFVLRPEDATLRASGLLQLQTRATQDAGSLAPERRLADLAPASSPGGRQLLLPRQSVARAGARSYVELTAEQPTQVEIGGEEGRRTVQPRLLFRRRDEGAFGLQVLVDGASVVDEEWAGRQGELTLPPMATGAHQVEVRGDAEFFLGSVLSDKDAYVRRLAFRAPRQFDINWQHDGRSSSLSARLFSASGAASCRLEAELLGGATGGTLSTGHTFGHRAWSPSTAAGDTIAALGTDVLELRRSEALVFVVHDDIPAGSSTLRYTVECPEPVFMTLSQVVPETAARSTSFRER